MSETPGWARPGDAPGAGAPPPPVVPPAAPVKGQPPPDPWGNLPGYPPTGPVVVRPGIVPLRPLALGEIYDGSFQAVRTNPGAMLGAAAVIVVVLTVVQLSLQAWLFGALGTFVEATADVPADEVPDTDVLVEALGTTSVAAVLAQVASVLALALLAAVVIVVVGEAVLGRRTAVGELWGSVRPRLLPLVGVTFLVGLVTVAVIVACFLPGLALLAVSVPAAVALLLLGVVAALCLGLWLDTRLSMAGPALVLERQPVLRSVARSWRLTGRGFWRILGIRVLTFIITGITAAIVAAPFQIIVFAFFSGDASDPTASFTPSLPALVLTGIGSAVGSVIVFPFTAAVTALLYIDQRMRLEGLDVELARAAAEPA